jgi:hypothetical protein
MKTDILNLILNQPNVRTVEIADRLDLDVERVRPLIADELRSGAIVEEEIRAPNGCLVQSFRYARAIPAAAAVTVAHADPFPARVIRALPPAERPLSARPARLSSRPLAPMPKPAADPLTLALAPAHIATPAQVADEPLEIDVPVTRKADDVPVFAALTTLPPLPPSSFNRSTSKSRVTPKGRIELGVDFLIAAGGEPVTSAALSKAMGLADNRYPGAYLRTALADGRVVRAGENGKDWASGRPSSKPQAAIMAAFTGAAALDVAPAAVELPEPAVAPRNVSLSPDEAELLTVLATTEPTLDGCVAGISDPCECGDCETVAAFEAELAQPAPVEQVAAPVEPKAQAQATPPACDAPLLPSVSFGFAGGLPNIKTPYLPPVAPGAPIISRSGLYENGVFRKTADEILAAQSVGVRGNVSETVAFSTAGLEVGSFALAANDVRAGILLTPPPGKFDAGVMMDGSLEIRAPGKAQLSLSPEQARELYQFMQRMGYAAWPTAA